MTAELLVAGLAEPHVPDDVDLMNHLASAAVGHPGGRPWRLWPVDNGIEIRAERKRGALPSTIGERTVRITAGAALANIRLGFAVLGHRPVVTLLPNLTRAYGLAVIRRGEEREPTPAELRLFAAIEPVGRFLPPVGDLPVPPALIQRVRAAVEAEGLWLRSVDDVDRERLARRITRIADLPAQARLMAIGSNHDVPVEHLRAGLALQRLVLTARTLGGTANVLGWPADLVDAAPLPASIAAQGMWPLLLVGLGRPAWPALAPTTAHDTPEAAR